MTNPSQQKPLTLTLVIPVFNEELHIKNCLNAIAQQTVMPNEVIVVDNNCTDKTIEIARTYPFVSVIKESRQGRGWARSAGFDGAGSDIIGRIDADSYMMPDWCEKIIIYFSEDNELAGVTGLAKADMFPFVHAIKSTLPSRGYFWFVHAEFRTVTMWGANMAITSKAWLKVREKVINDDSRVHEDQDVSLWMAAEGFKIVQKNDLRITISGQSYRYLPKSIYYTKLFNSTKHLHSRNGNLTASRVRELSLLHVIVDSFLGSLVIVYIALLAFLTYPIDYILIKRGHTNYFKH